MSFMENVSEISENNATIAENQQKVYEAGVRAGLAQTPDYSEGYEDGYASGVDDSLGGYLTELIDGKVKVGKAKEADHAASATNAVNAEHAGDAGHATNADHATGADHAASADQATEADHAAEAGHAAEADHATEADHADSANVASYAAIADNAVSVPAWNVDSDVGAISPSVNMVELSVVASSNESSRRASDQIRIPMINSGDLYLDFKITLTMDKESGVTYKNIVGKVDIYLNDTLAKTCGGTYADGDFTSSGLKKWIEVECRNLLSVSMGDVVTVIATLDPGYGSVKDTFTMKVEGVQLKANIVTAHTYLTLGEDLESPSAAEILDIILGEE